jgi:hypothetical protein
MNAWQMDSRVLKWDSGGGHATDNKQGSHYSIHPRGRTDEWRRKQKRRRSESASQRYQARLERNK